jgi:hypothetical protein
MSDCIVGLLGAHFRNEVAGLCVPNSHPIPLVNSGNEPSIGMDRDAWNIVGPRFRRAQNANAIAGFGVPEMHGLVARGGRDQLAVPAQGHIGDDFGVVLQHG